MLSPLGSPVGSRTRAHEVRQRLEALIGRMDATTKLPTAAQLCQSLGISTATLNKVLKELERDGWIERRHGVGIFIAHRHEKAGRRVLLLCDPSFFASSNHSPFWEMLLEGLRERAAVDGDAFEYHFARPDELSGLDESLIARLNEGRVDGVLGIGLNEKIACFLEERVPYVTFAGWSNHMVGIDWKVATRLAVQALSEKGCRRIGAWLSLPVGRPYELRTVHMRERVAFRGALHRSDLPFDASLWRNCSDLVAQRNSAFSSQEQGYALAHAIWHEKEGKPDGVLIFDDMMARGALTALTALGVRPGEDVQVATLSNRNSDVLLGYEKCVIRVEAAPSELVDLMFDQLNALMQGQKVPRVSVNIKPKLCVTS